VSGGYVADEWELHATAFTPPPTGFPNPLQSVGTRESGGAVTFERRFASMAALGAQARIGYGTDVDRYQGGLVGKLWIEQAKVQFLAEGDFIRLQVPVASAGVNQFVSYVGATFFPIRGLMAGLVYERFQADLSLKNTAYNAFDAEINFFPWAHFELVLFGRYQTVSSIATGAPNDASSSLLMGQIHYYM
jgi:hypothetical protein